MQAGFGDGSDVQMAIPLLNAVRSRIEQAHAPFYTPGHKHGRGAAIPLTDLFGARVFQADLPELPELDNLFAPQGVIQQAQALAAEAFGADRTWFLVNGSTAGMIATILATCGPGDRLILSRNVHQSAISGLILAGATPIFVQPEYDAAWDMVHSMTPTAVAATLKQHPDAKAILMVCPTYHGVCGDVTAIAQLAHQYGIPLLVDEAHGPHFAFHPGLPTAALAAGADLVVQSTHKVLSAMTQAAMLHLQGERVQPDRVSKALQLVQSSSPSYLLLASLDAARHQMATEGQALLEHTLTLADTARSRLGQISGLAVLSSAQAGQTAGFVALDRTRLTVNVSGLGIDGFTADTILNEQLGVTAELPSLQHLTFIISVGNTAADVEQLVQAWTLLARRCRETPATPGRDWDKRTTLPLSTLAAAPLTPRDAFFATSETVAIAQAAGRISAELICPYPPGIPVLMPGEIITKDAIAYLQKILAIGGTISGCADPSLETLRAVVP